MQEELSQIFERSANEEFHNSSPLYEHLSLAIAKDPEMLSLAAHCRKGERAPNLFFAAVHLLFLKGTRHPLSLYYQGLSGSSLGTDDPYPTFRSFCLEYDEEIRSVISARMVQTNEVSRCACLVPAFVLVSRGAKGRPLHLVEIGASAGLNLLWDRYAYDYGEMRRCGDMNSPVQIKCAVKGKVVPPLPETFPEISAPVGIDVNPLDVNDRDHALWLRALVWRPVHRSDVYADRTHIAQPSLILSCGIRRKTRCFYDLVQIAREG